MKFYVMADTELTHIAMNWPAGPYGQYRIGDDGYVTDEQFVRVIPDPLDQSLYEYIANGGPLTDEVISAAVRGEASYIDTLASQAIDNDPDAPVYYTEGEQDEWKDSLNDGFVKESELKTERAHVMPGTKKPHRADQQEARRRHRGSASHHGPRPHRLLSLWAVIREAHYDEY